MIFRIILLVIFVMALGGCTGCTQDPSEAGFFCGIKNIVEGSYEQRQTALRSEAEESEAVARRRGDQLRALENEEASLFVEKKELQRKLAAVQADIDKQKLLLANARLQQRADRGTLVQLETRLKALQEMHIRLGQSGNTSVQEVEILKLDIVRLQGHIDNVLKLTAVE